MSTSIARSLFLAAACSVLGLAASNWWEPGLTVVHSRAADYQPLERIAAHGLQARQAGDPQGLLMLFGLVQGMRS
ncbi:hypothetical protein [Pseudomonas oryzae]|uniref:Uncharacterized protein n=1 Tax=Pseudomonas oryzae TaxID=1392877 RepID=A0A1H1LJH4_9PSED|nr:hypothetical protein [Pseudomonas oryzae]SDR74472.1 hypothetical protein SAMN05216221_0182 [Pseudomonas oryzae]